MRGRLAAAGAVTAVAAAWALLVALAPWLAAPGSDDGSVFAAALAFRAGSAICHQQAGRSFAYGGVQLPVCARCTGLYAGAAAGAVAAWVYLAARAFRRRRGAPAVFVVPLTAWRVAAVACGAPTLAAWAAEHLAGLPVSNLLRALAALPLGAAIAVIVTVWAGGAAFDDTRPATAIH